MGQVVRGPKETPIEEYGGVEVLEEFRLLAEVVEGDGHECADEETPQEGIIDGARTVHLLGTKGSPKYGSGEERVDSGAGEPVLLVRRTDVGDLGHLVVENGGTDEGRHEGRDHLTVEGDPGWDVNVVREFEILGEVEGMGGRDVSVGLKVVHCGSVTGEPKASKQFGDDVQRNLNVRDGHDDTAGDTEDEGKEDAIQDDGRRGVGGISTDTSSTQSDRDYEDGEIDVLGNLLVAPHEAGVDILGVCKGGLAAGQVLETGDDLTTVVKVGVGDGRGVDGEEHAVEERVSGGEVQGRVSLVRGLVEETVCIDCLQDLVTSSSVIKYTVGIDWDVGSVPSVGVPDGEDDGEGDEGPEEGVEDAVERVDEWVTRHDTLVPIPCGEGVQSQTTVGAGDGSQVNVLGSDPGRPVEVGHGGDEVVGEPEVDEHGDEAVCEPPHPGHGPSICGSVCSRMESPVQRDGGQIRGPDSARGVHKETAGKTGQTVTDEVGRQGNKDLVAEATSPCLVEVEGEVLHPNDVSGVRGREPNVGHDCDNHMFLHVELARIESPFVAESGEHLIGKGNFE